MLLKRSKIAASIVLLLLPTLLLSLTEAEAAAPATNALPPMRVPSGMVTVLAKREEEEEEEDEEEDEEEKPKPPTPPTPSRDCSRCAAMPCCCRNLAAALP